MSSLEEVIAVMRDDWTWQGVSTKMVSVLKLFNWRKLLFIHDFLSSRKAVSVQSDDLWAKEESDG